VFVVLFAIFYVGEKRRLVAELPKGYVERVELPYKKVWGYVIMAAVSLYLYELFVVYAAYLPSAIYYPLSKGITVLCTFLLDVIVFKDKVTPKKLIGLAMVMVAIVLVTL
jgi:multidrug transporter EmrE-like cation transporter